MEIKAWFRDWHKVDEDQARQFVIHLMSGMVAVKEEKKAALVESNHLRGTTVAALLGK